MQKGFKILDNGHKYELNSLDGNNIQLIQFVKRFDPNNPNKFPGNTNSYSGTTLQMVLRVLIDRVKYLQNQIFCFENVFLIKTLQIAIWLLEFRAARRHSKIFFKSLNFASNSNICVKCGHTICNCSK